jgi:hypothetical protein
MKFNYCIWLSCSKQNEMYNYTNGFFPHITIKMKLSYKESVFEYFQIKKNKIYVELIGEPVKSYEDGFAALYYNVIFSDKNQIKKPKWWPDNAHISFLYKYYKMITATDIEHLKKKINRKNHYLDHYKLMFCNNHHETWKLMIKNKV